MPVYLVALESITGTDRVIYDLHNTLQAEGLHSIIVRPLQRLKQSALGRFLAQLPGKRLISLLALELWLASRAILYREHFTVVSFIYPLWGPGLWLALLTGRARYYYFLPDMMWKKAYVADARWSIFSVPALIGLRLADKILVPTASAEVDCLTFLPRKLHTRIERLATPIDPAYWEAVEAQPVAQLAGKRFIFHPAGLKPNKNTERTIRAFALAALSDVKFAYIRNAVNSAAIRDAPGTGLEPLERLTDGHIKWLYQNCEFVSVVSIEEGVGLPLLEAAHFGKDVVTSCASAMPEVGAGRCRHVDPFDEEAIAEAFRAMARGKAERFTTYGAHRPAQVRRLFAEYEPS